MEAIRRDNWSAGANNIAPRDRLPEASLRAAVNAGNIEHAQDIAAETIASIEAAVAGIGNNA